LVINEIFSYSIFLNEFWYNSLLKMKSDYNIKMGFSNLSRKFIVRLN